MIAAQVNHSLRVLANRTFASRVGAWLSIALGLLIAAGCGDGRLDRVPVAGQVLIDGQPLAFGEVMFVPAHGRPSHGKLDSQGRFKLTCYENEDGAVLGQHKVAVRAGENLDYARTKWHAPKKYQDHQTSGLTQEVSGPTDNVVIELSWDGSAPFVEVDEHAEDTSRYGRPK